MDDWYVHVFGDWIIDRRGLEPFSQSSPTNLNVATATYPIVGR